MSRNRTKAEACLRVFGEWRVYMARVGYVKDEAVLDWEEVQKTLTDLDTRLNKLEVGKK